MIFSTMLYTTAAEGFSTSGLSPKNNMSTMPVVCKSMDIRNNISSFDVLENCTVVEGFVQILLLDNVTEAEFKTISFPRLTEITDYLLLYRVTALRSVGQLFPNLAVIRGQTKMFEYSLIIYEMANLQDIGLHNLREISSGLVRVDKNPSLCFVHSIDWSAIVLDKHGEHFMKNIRSEEECPLCPSAEDSALMNGVAVTQCPGGRCWNREHCQRICPPACNNSCDSKGNCCAPNCIGCVDDEPTCLVCRNVVAMLGRGCMDKCPDDTYMYLNRRCVTKSECIAMPRPLQFTTGKSMTHDKYHKVLTTKDSHGNTIRKCVLECPADHTATDNECVKCEAGRCHKECPGIVIDSLSTAQELRGCTHINGSLEIQIRGGKNIVSKLDESLSMIEVIDGYLKVVRSFPLISLNFFKKLRHIRGNVLDNKKFVIFVLDNQNLQELWDWTNRTLRIDQGKLFFHFNPRLCRDKIRTLQLKTNLPDYTEIDVASNSNGDKIACNITDLNVTAEPSRKAIVLKWDPFVMKDHRKLLNYVVYSIEAPHQNITMFDGRDACSGESWRVEDVAVVEGKVTHLLSNLKPYTQYAFYVRTYTIASEDSGAQSAIHYVRTAPGKPTKPVGLKISATNHSFHVTWKPPILPNGEISHYVVTLTSVDEKVDKLRDFCSAKTKPIVHIQPTTIAPRIGGDNKTCVCSPDTLSPSKSSVHRNATTAEDQINFEDYLYDFVYIKREESPQHLRKTRSISSAENYANINKTEETSGDKVDHLGRVMSIEKEVNETEFFIDNLVHYKKYNVKVQVCRKTRSKGKDEEEKCSATTVEQVRTHMRDDVDLITTLDIKNVTSDSAIITWEDPVDPNGYIESYHITYGNLDDNDPHNQTHCISITHVNAKRSYRLSQLKPGNWCVEMSVTSQAGTGRATGVSCFHVQQSNEFIYYIIAGVILFLALGAFAFKFFREYYRRDDMKLITSINPDYIPTPYVPDDWEVPRDKIKLLNELGQGSFGMVYEGIAKDIKGKSQIRCAVKTVNEHATNRERIEFLNEASVMKAFDTAHVVRLLGVVSQGQPTLVIMELMANGDLKTYLRSHRPDSEAEANDGIERKPPNLKQILNMAIEISDGMAYLSAKKFVHRDVAARNCMVSENLVVKIGDFGMTRDIYETDYYRKGSKGLLPVRWMAPESLKDGVFTSASDVWSYGVVLWEMATLASQPYQGLTNDQVLRYVIGGNIMERPEQCPDILYDLMKLCWNHKPSDRPTFLRLCDMLMQDARQGFEMVSFYHSPAGIEARNQRMVTRAGDEMDDVTIPLRIDEQTDDESDHEPAVNGYVVHQRQANGTNA